MKKVWVLERYVDKADMEKTLKELEEMIEFCKSENANDEVIESCKKSYENYKVKMNNNPEGYWGGVAGKSVYKQFCYQAKDSLRYYLGEKHEDVSRFRVVEGLIEDSATMWINYKMTKVNDGVMRYLLATYKK